MPLIDTAVPTVVDVGASICSDATSVVASPPPPAGWVYVTSRVPSVASAETSTVTSNDVVETNVGAIRLWERLGFEIVGTVPRAYRHPDQGFVDAHVMHKWLNS